MKTQILRLDPHDDIISTRDRMGWSKAGRILLIWPERGRILTRRLDLVLLQRHAAGLGAQLAIVTTDPLVREHASGLGVLVFNDLRQAQRSNWRPPRRFRAARPPAAPSSPADRLPPLDLRSRLAEIRPPVPAWLSDLRIRLAAFTVGLLAVLALLAALLPAALIRLEPAVQTQEMVLQVSADPELTAINLSGQLPARPITVTVEGRDSLPASGRVSIPDQPARAEVVFTNLTETAQAIPAGAIVRSLPASDQPPLRFATTRPARIPAGVGQSAIIPVQALLPGSLSNLPAGSLVAIEGPLGLLLTANNPAPAAGGTNRQAPQPTPADRSRLASGLEPALRLTALQEIQARLQPGDLLFTSTLTITRILEQAYTPAALQPANQLDLSLRLEYQALVVSAADLHSLAASLLDASLPAGYTALPATLTIEQLTPPHAAAGQPLAWQVRFARQLQAVIPPARAASLSLGQNPQTASERLSAAFDLASPPRIYLNPPGWPFLPLLPYRIDIVP